MTENRGERYGYCIVTDTCLCVLAMITTTTVQSAPEANRAAVEVLLLAQSRIEIEIGILIRVVMDVYRHIAIYPVR